MRFQVWICISNNYEYISCMELGVNTKFGLGLPIAKQIGLAQWKRRCDHNAEPPPPRLWSWSQIQCVFLPLPYRNTSLNKVTHRRLCKTAPRCKSHSVEHIFAQWFEKVLALCLVCGQTACRISKKIGPCNFLTFCVRILLIPKHEEKIVFLWHKWIWVDQLWPPKNEFSMMFNMFVNIFWRAEGFGYMRVPFDFASFNNLCLVFSLD